MKQLFQDVDGQYSSKRFMTLIALLLFAEMVQVNIFMQVQIDGELKNLVFILILSGMGFITAEKFTKRGVSNLLDRETTDK